MKDYNNAKSASEDVLKLDFKNTKALLRLAKSKISPKKASKKF